MQGPYSRAKEEVKNLISEAINTAIEAGTLPSGMISEYNIERPADTLHGDFATNVALASARTFRKAPPIIAQEIVKLIRLEGSSFEKVEIAGPGFINFYLKPSWFSKVIFEVLAEKENFGKTSFGKGEKVNVEFVSANPTGPMHMGNARGGALGDVLASCMSWAGYNVEREFYVNDAGNQIAKFGHSLSARYLQHFKGEDAIEFPEDGYHGADIKERAEEYIALYGDKLLNFDEDTRSDELVKFALPKNIEKMKQDLAKYRINYDTWFLESTLHESGAITNTIEKLRKSDLTYEKDGALWLKTPGEEEKDEVLVRANGIPTYFAADIAYHMNKFATRGFDRAINIWGADHHGHVARLKSALDAVGLDGSKLDIVLMQLVRLTKDGELVKMSKRTGNAISLTDLLDEIPIDAARFFFNMREPASALDFDLGLAVKEDSDNPVYYVQYAHARICSIVKNILAENIKIVENPDLSVLINDNEIDLIRELASFPEEIILSAKNYDPARMTHYAVELANSFHRFYNACRVKNDDEDLMQARLALCLATKQVLENVLTILNITAPEVM